MRAYIVIVACLAASACSPIPAPIVDHTGVDEAKYNQDLADCYNQDHGINVGNPVTRCMEAKGYKILVGY